jgi:ElaB/YqjD/DUF883 family membrane-anchored ribosome-binding protein
MSTQGKREELEAAERGADYARQQIGDDLRAIGDKLTPENIKQEIKTDAKEAIVHAKDVAVEKLRETTGSVGEAGRATLGFAQGHAVPLALIGVGLGWLLASRRHTDGGHRGRARFVRAREISEPGWVEQQGQRAEHLMHEGMEKGREVGHEAQRRFSRARGRSRDFAQENPLAVGALAMASGLGLGLLLPSTRKEDELLGPTRDRLMGEAKEAVEQVGQKAKETAREVSQKVGEPMTH